MSWGCRKYYGLFGGGACIMGYLGVHLSYGISFQVINEFLLVWEYNGVEDIIRNQEICDY